MLVILIISKVAKGLFQIAVSDRWYMDSSYSFYAHIFYRALRLFSLFCRCSMRVSEPVLLVIDCPMDHLYTDPSMWVMELVGNVTEGLLMSTTLDCRYVKEVQILNGQRCTAVTSTTTTNVSLICRKKKKRYGTGCLRTYWIIHML